MASIYKTPGGEAALMVLYDRALAGLGLPTSRGHVLRGRDRAAAGRVCLAPGTSPPAKDSVHQRDNPPVPGMVVVP